MSQASCLDPVIRTADAVTQAARPGEKCIIINANTRTAISAVLARQAPALKYFLVSTNGAARCQTFVIYFGDTDGGRASGLRVGFNARCGEGREEHVAEALCDDPSPGAVLVGKIKAWVREYVGRRPEAFIGRFFEAKGELEARLTARALAETGLEVTAEVSLCSEEEVARHARFGPVRLSVALRDFAGPLDVTLQAELVVEPEDPINAGAYRADVLRVEELVRESARQYFKEQVGVQRFHAQPATVVAELKEHLNVALRPLGRSVQTLDLDYDRDIRSLDHHGGMPTTPYETREEVECHVTGHAAPFIVSSAMQLSITDYATYLASGAPPLDAWLRENFEQVVRQTLSLLELEPVTRDIRNRMSSSAASIGCAIQQQPFITNGSIENWRNGSTLVAAATCETGLAGFRVGLRFEAVAVLTQVQGVRQYLARGLDLTRLMEQRALDEIRQTMLTLHPERLYARSVAAETGSEESWKTLLGRKVRDMLAREFEAEIISASVELTETEFDQWLKDLRREPISLEAEIASHDPDSARPFVFQGDCQIEDIAHKGWDKAWPAGLDVDKLRRQLSNALKAGMETCADLNLTHPNGAAPAQVREEIARLITDYARDELGLVVKVSNVRRQPTDVENRVRAAELANELLRVDLLHKLEERLIQLIANGGSEEEIAQVQKSLTLLRAYRPHDATLTGGVDWQTTAPEPDGRAGVTVPDDDDAQA
jgi:hypothetical protein